MEHSIKSTTVRSRLSAKCPGTVFQELGENLAYVKQILIEGLLPSATPGKEGKKWVDTFSWDNQYEHRLSALFIHLYLSIASCM